MDIIANLLKSIAIPNESEFQDIFDNFKTAISEFKHEKARSILRVVKREIENQLYKVHQDYEKGIIERSLDQSSIKLNEYFENRYKDKDFKVIVRCDQIILFCTEFFEGKPINEEPIIWKSETKRFGALIFALVEAGYIEIEKLNTGKYNFNKLSKLVLKHFKFEKQPDQVYLSKVINAESEKFDEAFYISIKIPNRITSV